MTAPLNALSNERNFVHIELKLNFGYSNGLHWKHVFQLAKAVE